MARIVSRRPVIGLVAGLVFGALGWLIIGIAETPSGVSSLAPILFRLAGYFFFFVAAVAIAATLLSLARSRQNR